MYKIRERKKKNSELWDPNPKIQSLENFGIIFKLLLHQDEGDILKI